MTDDPPAVKAARRSRVLVIIRALVLSWRTDVEQASLSKDRVRPDDAAITGVATTTAARTGHGDAPRDDAPSAPTDTATLKPG